VDTNPSVVGRCPGARRCGWLARILYWVASYAS
jgi:hypothetical protein